VGYKSACHLLETARDGLRRRPDSASCSPPLKQATSRSKPRKIEASGANFSTLCTPSPFPAGLQVLRLVARLKAGYKWSDSAHFQQPKRSAHKIGRTHLCKTCTVVGARYVSMEWSATLQVLCICIPSGQGPHRALEGGVHDNHPPSQRHH